MRRVRVSPLFNNRFQPLLGERWWLKMCRLMLVPMLLLVAGSALADLKIAVVNVQRAIGECDEAKAMSPNSKAISAG